MLFELDTCDHFEANNCHMIFNLIRLHPTWLTKFYRLSELFIWPFSFLDLVFSCLNGCLIPASHCYLCSIPATVSTSIALWAHQTHCCLLIIFLPHHLVYLLSLQNPISDSFNRLNGGIQNYIHIQPPESGLICVHSKSTGKYPSRDAQKGHVHRKHSKRCRRWRLECGSHKHRIAGSIRS